MLKHINYASNANNADYRNSDAAVASNDLMCLMTNETPIIANLDSDHDALYANMNDNDDELKALVREARAAFSLAKENASWAAAHTYMLWLKTTASSDAASWFNEQVKARNAAITQDNKMLVADSLPADAVRGLAAGEKLVKIAARAGTSNFTVVVKYALDFVHPKQATNVSRYVLVLEWVHSAFENRVVADASVLVKAINDAGGFETVVRMQRAMRSSGIVKAPAKEKSAPTDKYQVIFDAKCLGEVDFNAKHAEKGFVVLIGRFAAGKVQVVGELKLTQAQLDAAVANLDEFDFQPATDLKAAA